MTIPRISLAATAVLAFAMATQAQDTRSPVPAAEAQQRALTLVREVYESEYEKARTLAQKETLAGEMVKRAGETADLANKYTLLRVARDLSIQGGGPTAFLAVDEMAKVFQIDALAMNTDVLAQCGALAKTSLHHKAVAEKAVALINEALAADNFPLAGRLADLGLTSAEKSRNGALLKQFATLGDEVRDAAAAYATAKAAIAVLHAKPTDPDANLAVGKYYCFIKGDWGKGLPMLALGSDAASRDLATRELKGAPDATGQMALGDGWWKLAETAEGDDKRAMLRRAGQWYKTAETKLSGLDKAKAQKRLEEIAKLGDVAEIADPVTSAPDPAWDVAKSELLGTIVGHTGSVWWVAFSPDGRLVASAGGDKNIVLWDVATGRLRRTLTGHTDQVRSVAFSPDGRLLASASTDKTAKLWDIPTGRLRRTLQGHTDIVLSVAFSPNGKQLVSGGADKILRFWNPVTGQLGRTIVAQQEKRGLVHSVAFSPNGASLAAGNGDGSVKLWETATGRLQATLEKPHTNWVVSVAFSPDGRVLASGGKDKTVKLMDVATGELRATLSGHTAEVRTVAFSRDGKVLASAGYDETIRLWDVATGQLRGTLTGHAGPVHCLAFSPDGKILISGGEDKTIKLWGPPGGKP
ncbi:MAG: WD40 repeat domain-containing protein [Planctomycetes bacterium]|nr:WD40 repeat domain-containing protein [Planctomycetota bacterium]